VTRRTGALRRVMGDMTDIEGIFDGGYRRDPLPPRVAGPDDEPGDLTLPEGWENTPRRPGPGWSEESEVRYLVPPGAQWAAYEPVNGVLSFMTDSQVMQLYRQNAEEFGDPGPGEAPGALRAPGSAEEAWRRIHEIWEGDPGGRGWEERVPDGAQWLSLRKSESWDSPREETPEWHFDAPPLMEGEWATPGYGGESFGSGMDGPLGPPAE
jgi:hypothetical protein